jgi:hypothetical protein
VPTTTAIILTPGDGRQIVDSGLNIWTIDAGGNVIRNGTPVPGGDGSSGLTYDPPTGAIYGQDAASGTWWNWTAAGGWVQSVFNPAPPVVVTPPADVPVDPPVVTPPAGAIVLPKITAGYPQSAFLVTAAQASQLQTLLDAHKIVRLENKGYGSPKITVKTGQQIYGLPRTDFGFGNITIAPGTTGAVVCGINQVNLEFPGANGVTQGNVFKRIVNVAVNIHDGAQLDGNLFLGMGGCGIYQDPTTTGYVNRCRFIFNRSQSSKRPDIVLTRGDGNVFLWKTFQSTQADFAAKIQNAKTAAFAGIDCEDFTGGLFWTDTSVDVLRVFGLNGGSNQPGASGFTVAGAELQVQGGNFFSTGPGLAYQPGNKRSLVLNVSGLGVVRDNAPGASRQPPYSTAIGGMVNPARSGLPWERPSFDAIPDPVPGWATPPRGYTDSTAAFANGITAQGIYMAPAGTFYVDGSIPLRPDQGVIGAGDGKTIIIATKGQDIFVPNLGGTAGKVGTAAVHVMDCTLYGGAVPIHFRNTGDQPNGCVFSHVTFRGFKTAGVHVDNIYGMDNNFFDALNFVSGATALKQTASPDNGRRTDGVEGWIAMSYIDKTVLYGCQFVGNQMVADWQATRPDNLNALIGCRFSGNASMGRFTNQNTLLFAWCDGDGNGTLQTQQVHLLSCNFKAANAPLLAGDVNAEGCIFTKGSAAVAVKGSPGNDCFVNCQSELPYGTKSSGVVINSSFPDIAASLVTTLANGVATQAVQGKPAAKPQILVGAVFG